MYLFLDSFNFPWFHNGKCRWQNMVAISWISCFWKFKTWKWLWTSPKNAFTIKCAKIAKNPWNCRSWEIDHQGFMFSETPCYTFNVFWKSLLTMVVVWYYYGCSVVLLWLECGTTMVVVCNYYCCSVLQLLL